MLETFTSISTSWFIHASFSDNEEFFNRPNEEICCPQPRRTASPALASSYRQRTNLRGESDWEECEEIKQILLQGQLSMIETTTTTLTKMSLQTSSSDIENLHLRGSSSSHILFNPTKSPVKLNPTKFNSNEEILLDSSDSDNDLCDLNESSSYHYARRKALRRPKLGVSTSNLSGFDRTEPVMTPPLRSHNPLPLNLQFRKVSDGAEFGLFSISPPSRDDEDVLLRRERYKRKTKGKDQFLHPVPSQLVYQHLQDLVQHQEMSDLDMIHNDGIGEGDVFGYVFDVEVAL